MQNFKKLLPADPELWGCTILGTKMAHFSKWEFFSEKLFMILVPFIHDYLHAKNQSQILISEILTIKEYWNLIGREPFLDITWELDFSQACSFCKMLMNHKNFHFTQIPDKTNDVIFIKTPKTMFLGHFCPMGIFSKKSSSVTNNYVWAPNTMLSFRKN